MPARPRAPLDGESLGPNWVDHDTLGLTRADDPNPAGLLAWNTPVDARAPSAPTSGAPVTIAVPTKITVNWDVALLRLKRQGLTGDGRCYENSLMCHPPGFPLDKTPTTYNAKCSLPVPGTSGHGKKFKDTIQKGVQEHQYPDVELALAGSTTGAWLVKSVTCYTVVRIAEPLEGAFPVPGKNVTKNPADGLRKLNGLPSEKSGSKGYYEKVAENLELYKSATNKPYGRMRWWVKGSTLRHENEHHRLYKTYFESAVKGYMEAVAKTLAKEAGSWNPKTITRLNLEKRAGALLRDLMVLDKKIADTHEDQVSAMTAQEFKREAEKLRKWGKAGGKP